MRINAYNALLVLHAQMSSLLQSVAFRDSTPTWVNSGVPLAKPDLSVPHLIKLIEQRVKLQSTAER
jgi:hypothetical protein